MGRLAFDKIRFVFFDYGGVLDSNGVHSRTLFWEAAVEAGLFPKDEDKRKVFQEAYTLADHSLMKDGSAKGMGLSAFNRHNFLRIAEELQDLSRAGLWEKAAGRVTDSQGESLAVAYEVLKAIPVPKGIISNFTGNLETILAECNLSDFFAHVTESFYVGASKPDLHIFLTALSKTECAPEECAYVGDNIINDMEPGKALGLNTILLSKSEAKNPAVDLQIQSLAELQRLPWHPQH